MRNLYIVFDLDDTLYLERDYVRSGFQAVGRWLESTRAIEGFAGCAWELFESGVRSEIMQKALNTVAPEVQKHCVSEMLAIYRNHNPEIRLCPDASYCLDVFKSAARGLITDGRAEGQHGKCKALGLIGSISPIVCTGVWGERFYKPHPRAFEYVERSLNGEQGTLVYVADNPIKDFTAPLARGWKTVRIRRPEGLHAEIEALPSAAPHLELPDLWQLPDAVTML